MGSGLLVLWPRVYGMNGRSVVLGRKMTPTVIIVRIPC